MALDAGRLAEVLPEATAIRPVLRRLDAREFHVTEYIIEAQVGARTLLACTLRPQGGYGATPSLRNNVAGQHLLWSMVHYLNRA